MGSNYHMKGELAWMAGFFDGEGCILINRRWPTETNGAKNVHHQLSLQVGSTNHAILELWKETFGGFIAHVNRTEKRPGHADSWTWFVRSNLGENVLKALLPHLILKKKEALCALEFQTLSHVTSTRRSGQFSSTVPIEVAAQRDAYYWRLRELKREAKTYNDASIRKKVSKSL